MLPVRAPTIFPPRAPTIVPLRLDRAPTIVPPKVVEETVIVNNAMHRVDLKRLISLSLSICCGRKVAPKQSLHSLDNFK